MLEWGQCCCEEVHREPIRCGRNVLIKPTWCNRDEVETLSWYATVGGIRTEPIEMQECRMSRRRHKYEKSSMQTVTSTTTSHKAKRDGTQLRVVTLEHADAMCAPEHHASTLHTRALRSVTSRMMSKCRTRQLESCDPSSAFFHAWRERGVRVKPPKDPRLSDGWRWQLAGAFLLLSPGGARMMTDAECVENLAGLSAVKELKPSSRASGGGQCSVLETSTAAERVVRRKDTRIPLYLEKKQI